MRRKSLSVALSVAVSSLQLSCYRIEKIPPRQMEHEQEEILGALRGDGTRLGFPSGRPAIASNGELCMEKGWTVELHAIPRSEIQEAEPEDEPARVVTKDGRSYQVSRLVSADEREIRFESREPLRLSNVREIPDAEIAERRLDSDRKLLSIRTRDGRTYQDFAFVRPGVVGVREGKPVCSPLSEYEQLTVRSVSAGKTVILVVGTVVLALGTIYGILLATKESCPFIYSYDGERYVFDAEPYGGAMCHALQRTEWCGLEHLKPTGGRYRLRVTNEVDETQHTDELKLVVVDHRRGTTIVPDQAGGLHEIAAAEPPTSARDRIGRDLLGLVVARDGYAWQSQLTGRTDAWDELLREELTLEFPKPPQATRGRLVFNGCNTLWASQMLKRYLELYGREVQQNYARMEIPFVRRAIEAWNLREELYRLQIRVETPAGWVNKGTVLGGGPFVAEDKAYPLDLQDVEGDRLRLRFLPPAGFWMIDSIAIDYDEERPSRVVELAPLHAVDQTGTDVRDSLAASDGRYLTMPETGNWADLSFAVPPQSRGLQRSFLVKASGYYDIHLAGDGEPRHEILTRYRGEPGFPVRFALEEYRRFLEERQAAGRAP